MNKFCSIHQKLYIITPAIKDVDFRRHRQLSNASSNCEPAPVFLSNNIFAIFIDTIHRAQDAFIVALGIDRAGEKHPLGFWQPATENSDICRELFADMQARGLTLGKKTLWITDGGKGIIKALRESFGTKLLHQRCTIHKDRNIQKHLPKRYRKMAHRRFTVALEQNSYADARQMLLDFEKWLRSINESAGDSLVRDSEGNIKRYRSSAMSQRWLAAVLLHCKKGFRRIKGYADIADLLITIEQYFGDETVSAA